MRDIYTYCSKLGQVLTGCKAPGLAWESGTVTMTGQISGLRGRQQRPLIMSALTLHLSLVLKNVNWWNPEIKMWAILWGLLQVHHHFTWQVNIVFPSTHRAHGTASVDCWILPVSVFADVWPGRTCAGLWAIEVGQDVFQVFFISSLAHDLFDDTGRDGYSTLGSIFILPERQSQHCFSSQMHQICWVCLLQPVFIWNKRFVKHCLDIHWQQPTRFFYGHHENSNRDKSAFVWGFFFLKCSKYNPIG